MAYLSTHPSTYPSNFLKCILKQVTDIKYTLPLITTEYTFTETSWCFWNGPYFFLSQGLCTSYCLFLGCFSTRSLNVFTFNKYLLTIVCYFLISFRSVLKVIPSARPFLTTRNYRSTNYQITLKLSLALFFIACITAWSYMCTCMHTHARVVSNLFTVNLSY